jgi:hypothetical protein
MALKFFEFIEKSKLTAATEKDLYHVFLVDNTTKTYSLETVSVSEEVALATVAVYTRIGKSCVCLFKKSTKLFVVNPETSEKLLF